MEHIRVIYDLNRFYIGITESGMSFTYEGEYLIIRNGTIVGHNMLTSPTHYSNLSEVIAPLSDTERIIHTLKHQDIPLLPQKLINDIMAGNIPDFTKFRRYIDMTW